MLDMLPFEPQGKGLMETYLYQPSKSDLDTRLEDLSAGGSLGGKQLADVAEGEAEGQQSEDKLVLPCSALLMASGSHKRIKRHSEVNSQRGGRRSFELNTGSSFVSQRCVFTKLSNMNLK